MSTTWQDRLQESITLTSPKTKTKFVCDWAGSEMSADKRLGKFSYPLSIGTVVQDLGLSGFDMAFAVYFEGPNNDADSWKFLLACAEYGTWDVVHPVRGKLKLQLVKVAAKDGQSGGERPDCGAGIAHEQAASSLALGVRQAPSQAINLNRAAGLAHLTAELAQSAEHDPRVVGFEQTVQGGAALAQCRQQQHPVGDAF